MGPRRGTLTQRVMAVGTDCSSPPHSCQPLPLPLASAHTVLVLSWNPPPRFLHKTGPCRAGDTVSLRLH